MVEWKKMWELTAWDKKFQGVDKSMQSKIIPYTYLLAKDLFALAVPNGNIKLLSTGVQEGWTTEELAGDYLSEGEVVTIPWGKSPGAQNPVKYYKGKFVTGDNRIATSLDTNILNNKFLYYWMYSQSDVIESFYRGAGIQHPSMFKVLTMPVPILSISEQERIVGILDTFTSSIDNLKQQIVQRRKQYEYYRCRLFSTEKWTVKKIGDLTKVFSCPRVFKDQWQDSGVPFWRSSDIMSYHNGVINPRGEVFISQSLYDELSSKTDKIKEGDILVTGGGSIGIPYLKIDNSPLFVKDADLICIQKCSSIVPKYLYHYFLSTDFKLYLKKITHDATIAHYTINQIKDTPIPLPSLSEQQRIVDILDKFEASIQNLEAQLSQREKQYEYYRNKLLTFE